MHWLFGSHGFKSVRSIPGPQPSYWVSPVVAAVRVDLSRNGRAVGLLPQGDNKFLNK